MACKALKPIARYKDTRLLYTRVCSATLLLFLASAPVCVADQDASLQSLIPGTRVRILAPGASPSKAIGIVTQVSNDSVTLQVAGRNEPVTILRAKIERLEVSEGPRSRGVDATIGGVLGAGIAAAGCALMNRSGQGHLVSTGEVAGVCALFGGGIGAIVGVAIPPGERWKENSTTRYRVSFAPRLDHGLDLAVAWKF